MEKQEKISGKCVRAEDRVAPKDTSLSPLTKGLSVLLLSCSLVSACTSRQATTTVTPLENQNNIVEMGHRIDNIEDRLAVMQNTNQVYEVRNKAGKNTGWTAHPKPLQTTPVAVATPPVQRVNAQQSPNRPTTHNRVPSSHVPTLPATAQMNNTHAGTPSGAPTQQAPMGVLAPSANAQQMPPQQAVQHTGQHTYLPPENPVYAPGQGPYTGQGQQATQSTTQIPNHLVAASPAPAVMAPAANPTRPAPAPQPQYTPTTAGVQGAYKQALDLVLAGKSQEGRAKFQTFLQNYPTSTLAANAYYWIGESYYSQGNYSDALLAFKQVTAGYPKHDKNADALLKAGMTYQKLGDADNAAMQYRAVIADFPKTNAARIARSKVR